MSVSRRHLLQGTAGIAAAVATAVPRARAASAAPIRLGLLTVRTGPLASGGIDMETALKLYLQERNYTLAGRKIHLTVADTGGVPAIARTKTQELVEKVGVNCLVGPLAAFELLAIDDYVMQKEIPLLAVAAAEDVTQRHPNPWMVRATSSSAQCSQPMADYCAKDLKYKKMITIADDIAYGQEMVAGFQRVFEDNGGEIIQKLFPPLTAPDYGTYIAQLKQDADAIFLGFAGSNGFRFLRQFNEYGMGSKIHPIGGMTALDESVLRNMGNEALGVITTCWYSAMLDNPQNKIFRPAFRKITHYDPGFYAAATYTQGAVLEAALNAVHGNIEDKKSFMAALRATHTDTVRGPVHFDQFGNVVGNVYIRRVERWHGRLVNAVIKTYPDVSQFWTYDPKKFLAEPVYSRTWPPALHLEK